MTPGELDRSAEQIAFRRQGVGSATIQVVDFEGDPDKARLNVRKRWVSFNEASTAFGDSFGSSVPDPEHSMDEERFIAVGVSSRNRALIVAYAE